MSDPWTRTTREELQGKAEKLGLATTGDRKTLYQRIEQHLRDEVMRLDATDEEEALIEAATASHALAVVPDVLTDGEVNTVMDAWRSGEDLPARASTLPEMSRWAQMEAMAKVLARSKLMPEHIRNSNDPEADCIVILLTAHDLGLTSTLAFRKIAVINGRPTLEAELMRVLMQRDGHDIKVNVTTDAQGNPIEAEVLINRIEWHNDDWRGATFTMEQARTAGLASKATWKQWPEDMLVARATSRAARRYCSDSLGGISYTPEELGAIDVEGSEYTPSPTPEPEILPITKRDEIGLAIGVLDDGQQEWLRDQWKSRGIPPLNPKRVDAAPLTEAWLPTITQLLRDAHEQPSEAVVVEPVGVQVSGHNPYDAVQTADPTVVNATDPINDEKARAHARATREDRVEELREQMTTGDAKLDEEPSERAKLARAVLADAKLRAQAAGVIDALCPDCGVPMKEDNRACMTHPL